MIETSSVPPRKSSVIFGKCSESVRRRSSSLRNNFGKSSEILRRWSEIFGKSSKTCLVVCLYNIQNNTWTLGDMEFIFSCSHSISHSFTSLTRSISMRTLEDKFHISARPCIILCSLYVIHIDVWTQLCTSTFELNCANTFPAQERKQKNLTQSFNSNSKYIVSINKRAV